MLFLIERKSPSPSRYCRSGTIRRYEGAVAMNELVNRFISAFNKIEGHLRQIAGDEDYRPFSSLIRVASKSDPAVRRLKDDLLAYGDLRNVLLHRFRDNTYLSTPVESVVRNIEQISDRLLAPPLLESAFLFQVVTAKSDDKVGAVANRMYQGDLSQVPVIRDSKISGLLTTETIARWMAATFEANGGILEDAIVDQVLPFADPSSKYLVVPRTMPVPNAIAAFEEHQPNLDALIITANGRVTDSVLGIATVYDMPKLMSL
jgi:predicted transcriptional regulator